MGSYKGDVRLLFPTLYLAAPDLRGKEVTLTIRELRLDTLESKGDKEERPVLYFEETRESARKSGKKEKRLVLNKTNAKIIGALYGFEATAWAGRRITLYPTETEAFGERVECIRIKTTAPPEPKGGTPAAELETSDEESAEMAGKEA